MSIPLGPFETLVPARTWTTVLRVTSPIAGGTYLNTSREDGIIPSPLPWVYWKRYAASIVPYLEGHFDLGAEFGMGFALEPYVEVQFFCDIPIKVVSGPRQNY